MADAQQETANQSYSAYSKVAIYWDYENCPPPSGMPGAMVVDSIRKTVHNFGIITSFKAYLQIGESTKKQLRSELQSSGVSLTGGRKDAADKMILVDMLAFAIDHPAPATVVLISGDRDFVYALSILRNRKYNVVLIVPNKGASTVLKSQSDIVLEWRYDVLSVDISTSTTSPESSPGKPGSSGPTSPPIMTHLGSNLNLAQQFKSFEQFPSLSNPVPQKDITVVNKDLFRVRGIPNGLSRSMSFPDKINTTNDDAENDLDPKRFLYSPATPGYFDNLVEVLHLCRGMGDSRPKKKRVIQEMMARNPLLCQRANLSDPMDYIKMAEDQGIVITGGKSADSWISMNDNFVTQF